MSMSVMLTREWRAKREASATQSASEGQPDSTTSTWFGWSWVCVCGVCIVSRCGKPHKHKHEQATDNPRLSLHPIAKKRTCRTMSVLPEGSGTISATVMVECLSVLERKRS